MTVAATRRERRIQTDERWGRTALQIGLIYLAARAVSTGLLLLASAMSGPESRYGVAPGLAKLTMGWDAQWYWLVAEQGYPRTLPLTDSGAVAENAWAFMPVFAHLSNVVGLPLGSWAAGAFLVAFVAGYLCCLVLHRMLRPRIGREASLWAVVFLSVAPLSVLFQLGYAESLFLLWVLLAVWSVQERRYLWLYLLIPVMGYTRPGVLAVALFLGLFGVARWLNRRREPLRAGELWNIVSLIVLATFVGFSWQVIAWMVTGDPGAYLDTELAWRRNWVPGEGGFVPFAGWFQGAEFWFASWNLGGGWGIGVAGALIVGAAAVLIFEPHVRRLGIEVRLWAASYLIYLLAVFFPQTSIFRLLFPLSPLWGALAVPRSPVWRAGVLVLSLAGQWWWIWNMYGLGNTYWQIP